jgi:uncharacterized protein YcbX
MGASHAPRPGAVVGRVAGLFRYPVKALSGESLDAADVSWHGVAGDRRWGFALDDRAASGFPWLTLRRRPGLARYRARVVDPSRPDASAVVVTTPAGAELAVDDPRLAAELAAGPAGGGPGARALKLDRGAFDSAPLSLITTRSLDGIAALAGTPVAPGRVRPNLLVEALAEGGDVPPFPEDAWVGATLRIGAAGGPVVRVDRRDRRCVVVNVDPATGARDPAILRAIARHRQARLGTYATTVVPGRVAVGDPVVVLAPPPGAGDEFGAPGRSYPRSPTEGARR